MGGRPIAGALTSRFRASVFRPRAVTTGRMALRAPRRSAFLKQERGSTGCKEVARRACQPGRSYLRGTAAFTSGTRIDRHQPQ